MHWRRRRQVPWPRRAGVAAATALLSVSDDLERLVTAPHYSRSRIKHLFVDMEHDVNKPVTATKPRVHPAQGAVRSRQYALIGVSGQSKHARFQRYLRKHGFTGAIYPVNPTRRSFRRARQISRQDSPRSCSFIMLPARLVPDAVEQCAERRVQCVTIFSAGFAEIGERPAPAG